MPFGVSIVHQGSPKLPYVIIEQDIVWAAVFGTVFL